MSWKELQPSDTPRSHNSKNKSLIEISVGSQPGPGTPKPLFVGLTIRTRLIKDCPEFLVGGGAVRIQEGEKENAGKIRLIPGTSYRLSVPGGVRSATLGVYVVRFPLLKSMSQAKGRSSVEFDHAPAWLEIDIPEWALARDVERLAEPVRVSKKTPSGFSLAAGVSHDMRPRS